MKRRTFLTTAATLAVGAVLATTAWAHGLGNGGQGTGPGYMGQGYMGQGYMGQGYMGQGYMGQGYMGQGGGYHHGQGYRGKGGAWGAGDCPQGQGQALDKPLTVDDVRTWMEQRLEWRGNDRLKVGTVKEVDDQTIIAEIVTVDDSLVQRIQFDKATGRHGPAQ